MQRLNRGMKYRKTIAYGMIMMLLLQLFTGTNVQNVYADDTTPAVTQAELTFVNAAEPSKTITDGTMFIPGDCTEKDGQKAWSVAYNITNWDQMTVSERENVSLYLTVTRKDLQNTDAVETDVVKDVQIAKNSVVGPVWAEGAQYAVESDSTESGVIYMKQPAADAKYEYTITVAAKKEDTAFGTGSVKIQYVDSVPDICMTNVTPAGSVVAKTAQGMESGTWTNDQITFNVEIKDAYIGVKKVSFRLDGAELPEKRLDYEDANIPKEKVSQSFDVDTSAGDAQGHTFEVIATNAKGVSATWDGYILLDKDAPVIRRLTIVDTGKQVENTTYKRPVTLTTTVTDAVSSLAAVNYNVTKDDESTQTITVNADENNPSQYSYSFDQDGAYKVSVSAEDKAGNTVTSTEEVAFRVDGAGPVITQQSGQQKGTYYKDAQTFKYRIEDANLAGGKQKIVVKKDDREIISSEKEINSTDIEGNSYIDGFYNCEEEGKYDITVDAEDVVGNKVQQQLQCSFGIDRTAPELAIVAKDEESQTIGNDAVTNKKVHVIYNVTDRNHDISTYVVSVTRKDAEGITYPVDQTVNWTMSGADRDGNITASWERDYSEEGIYTIRLEGKDKAGNDGQVKTFVFTIDKTTPEITDITYKTFDNMPLDPKYNTIFHNNTIQVSFVVKDKLTGLRSAEPVKVSIGTAADAMGGTFYGAKQGPGTGVYYVNIPLETLASFDNKITVWAYDKAGNIKSEESLRTIYNTDPAALSVRCTTGNDRVWTNTDVNYQVSVSDTNCGLQSVICTKLETVDGVVQPGKEIFRKEYTTYQTGDDTISLDISDSVRSADGYTLQFEVTNNCGTTTTVTKQIYIDKEAPVTELSGVTDGSHYKGDLRITTRVKDISYQEIQGKRTTTKYYVTCVCDGQRKNIAWEDLVSDRYDASGEKVLSEEGDYTLYVVATDGAGNVTRVPEQGTISFTIDKHAPEISSVNVIGKDSGQEQSMDPDGNYYLKEEAQLQINATDHFPTADAFIGIQGKLDGDAIPEEKHVLDVSPLAFLSETYATEGRYVLTVGGQDKAGNVAAGVTKAVVVDKTGPKLSITGIGNAEMTTKSVRLRYESSDKNHDFGAYKVTVHRTTLDGVNETKIEQDASKWERSGYNRNSQKNYISFMESVYSEEGTYEITFEGMDKAGNVADKQTISFSIDRTAPLIEDVEYTGGGNLIGPKYGIIFNQYAIRVTFSVKDQVVGLADEGAVVVTIGKKDDRTAATTVYNTMDLQNGTYAVLLPLEDVDYFDNTITIWAYDKLRNERTLESKRTIYNTNASNITMECTTDNDGIWTNRDVTYHTVVADEKCGISKITYSKIENINGVETKTVVKEVDFEQQREAGLISEFVPRYVYDLTAKETVQSVDGYVLQVETTNNCGISKTMRKKVYVDKEVPEVELSGITDGAHYSSDQTITAKVKDISYKAAPAPADQKKRTTTKYYVTCRYDGQNRTGVWEDFVSGQYIDSDKKTFSQEGYYEIYAVTTDGAGNKTTSNTVKFAIDKEPPMIIEAKVIKGDSAIEQAVNPDGTYYVNEDGRLAVTVTDHFPTADGYVRVNGVLEGKTVQQEQYALTTSPYIFVTRTAYTVEGRYRVALNGADKAGNPAEQVNRNIVVDKTGPKLEILGIEPGKMTKSPVTLTYQAVDKNHDFDQYKVTVRRTDLAGTNEVLVEQNAADWIKTGYEADRQQDYTTTKTSTYTTEGNYEITLEGVDKAGNVGAVQTITFSIDHTAPVISDISYSDVYGLLAPKYGIIFSNQMIRVKFRVTDRVVGVEDSYVYVTLGEAKDRMAAAPLYMARKGEQGYYYVYVPSDVMMTEYDGVITLWANDRIRNESDAQTIRLIQNTDKPEIVMDCDLDYTKWQSRDVTFHTKVADNKSGLKEVTYSVDGKEVKKVEFTEFVKEYTYDLTATKTADKVSGYTVDIRVMNNNGTESEASRRVYIDKDAPAIRLSGVQNGTHYNKTQTIRAEVQDVSFKNTKTEYYVTRTIDGKTYTEKYTPFTMRKYEDRCTRRFGKEGRYQVYAVTTDGAGNRTRSNTLRFVVDKTAPKLAISGVESGSMNGDSVTLQFALTDSFYMTADASIRIEKTLDGQTTHSEVTSFPKKGKYSSLNRTFDEDGTYDITFTAKDRAGNVAKSEKISFSVDRTKPEIQITGTSNYEQWDRPVTVRFAVEESYYAGNHITIQGTRQDINGNVEELELPAISNAAKLSSLIQTFSKDGIYDFAISAKDEAGNQDEKEIHFILDQTRPEIHKVAQYQGGYYQEFKVADTLEEVFKDLTVVSYRILLNGMEYDGVTPVTEEGKYNLSVEVQDELGHKSTENVEFIIDHTAPKVIFTGVKEGQSVTESGSVILSLTNPEDEITAVSMNGVEYDADTRQLDYTEYGSYHIDVECMDKAGNHVVRTIQFTYHNPLTTIVLFAIMGGLIVMTCIWLWVRSIRKEKEEEKI